jgi:hypothetical protein
MKIWIIEPERACVTDLLEDLANPMDREERVPPDEPCKGPIREERRLYPRVPCFLLVDYASQGNFYRAFVRNLSANGAFIESHVPIPTAPDISLVISLPEHENPVKITGEVARSGGQGIGVRFHTLAEIVSPKAPPA